MLIHINKKTWEVAEIQRRGEDLENLRGKKQKCAWVFFFHVTGESQFNHVCALSSVLS